ncbi:uncharacterized protein LOC141906646 isoform X2 [Tubulanus polymorphus]|uniref:uncharacterized protein LOC141906646 isoform X2 n=1 Tax=Tubulanus polymorphus TaxID=672921 RepID=UPI003DA2B84B
MGNCKSKDASTDALEDRIAAKASKALANEAKKQLQNQSEITNHQSEESEAMVKDANHINNEPDVIKHTLDDVMAAPPPDEKPLLDEVVTGDLLKEIDFETSGVHTSPASIEDVEISETIIQTTDINQNDTDAQQQQLTNGNISSEQAATGSVNGELLVDTAAAQPAAAPIDAPVKPTDKDVTADLLSLDNSKEPDKSVSESNTADLLGLSANVDKGEPPSPVPSTVAGAPVDQKPAASVKSEATAPVTASTEHGLDAFDPLATPKPSQTDETKTASSSNKTIPSKKVDSPKKSGLPKPKQVQSSPKRSVSTEPTKTRPLSASTDAAAAKKSPAKTRPVSASVEGAVKATPHKPHSPKMTPTPRPTTAPTVSRSHSRSEADKVQSKCGSKDNIKHTPGGGNVKIESKKLDFKGKAKSRIGSLDNATHTPKGGEKKIESKKLEWKVESRVGSLQNATHKPKGGDKKPFPKALKELYHIHRTIVLSMITPNISKSQSFSNSFCRHVSVDVYNVIKKLAEKDDRAETSDENCSISAIYLTSSPRLQVFFEEMGDMYGLSNGPLLERFFRHGQLARVVATENLPFVIKYNKVRELLQVSYSYGFWDEYGMPQHPFEEF